MSLTVEDHSLPVHSYILTSKSSVFLEAMTAAKDRRESSVNIPLPDECRQDIVTVLTHLCHDQAVIQSAADAKVLAKFAHKFGMSALLELSGTYLVTHMSEVLLLSTALDATAFADKYQLKYFLATCEQYIVSHSRSLLSKDTDLSVLSQNSLLHVMKGLSLKTAGPLHCKACVHCWRCTTVSQHHSCRCPSSFSVPVAGVESSVLEEIAAANVAPVDTFLQWQTQTSSQ